MILLKHEYLKDCTIKSDSINVITDKHIKDHREVKENERKICQKYFRSLIEEVGKRTTFILNI